MTRLRLLPLALLACTPGQPDTLGGDTSSETSTGTEETGDGDPAEATGETTGSTEGEETGPGDGDGDGVHACADPAGNCYVPPWGELCPEGLADPCEWTGVVACIEPLGGCMIDYTGSCPDGWVSACE